MTDDQTGTREERLAVAGLGVAYWPSLAAAPTFAIMALLTPVLGGNAGYALLGRAGCFTAERNGPDVFAHERLRFRALAEAGLQDRSWTTSGRLELVFYKNTSEEANGENDERLHER